MPTPLCCAHIIVLLNRCASYYAHSSNVRLVFPVYILYFFTMPCIFWHDFRHRELCCILYNNILVLSSLTVSLMCWLLQHYLYPFSYTYHSVKTQRAHKLVFKIGKNRLYYALFLSHL